MEITTEMKDLVLKEATALKEHATKEEISNLDYTTLNPNDPTTCIYGQMTGDCFDKRANELIVKCCEKVYSPGDTRQTKSANTFIGATLNGTPTMDRSHYNKKFWSPIELYIAYCISREGEALIDFLKGETNDFKP